jgi:serine/threonine protein phosphatase 1
MRTIAIGDVHGCLTALQTLLSIIDPQPEDTIVFLGDYVDRGPDSAGVIEEVLNLQKKSNVVALKGNHEVTMLAAGESSQQWHFWMRMGGKQTLQSYGGHWEDIPDAHLTFLSELKRFWVTQDHFFVHGNYGVNSSLREQPDWLLIWEHIDYARPPKPHPSGRIAILGHTAQKSGEIFDGGHFLVIDTACVKGGWLTAYCVETDEAWKTNEAGEHQYVAQVRQT